MKVWRAISAENTQEIKSCLARNCALALRWDALLLASSLRAFKETVVNKMTCQDFTNSELKLRELLKQCSEQFHLSNK